MPYLTKHTILDDADCNDFRNAYKVGHNTYSYKNSFNERVIRYCFTDVLIFHRDGSITFNSDGNRTQTTKDRMNDYQSCGSVYQLRSKWYFKPYFGIIQFNREPIKFEDGMKVYPREDKIIYLQVYPQIQLKLFEF